MLGKILDFVSQGPVLAAIIIVATFLFAHPKDRLDYLIAGIVGVGLALILNALGFQEKE